MPPKTAFFFWDGSKNYSKVGHRLLFLLMKVKLVEFHSEEFEHSVILCHLFIPSIWGFCPLQDIQEAHAGQIVAVFGVDCASGSSFLFASAYVFPEIYIAHFWSFFGWLGVWLESVGGGLDFFNWRAFLENKFNLRTEKENWTNATYVLRKKRKI